ncbi:MAG TPA: homogentisate 1,2-dioxygenase [Chitinophagales bacterium]|nr:homogentisate 1,2-dioxygenase [Chitinophagales bacterium]HNF69343.1 homogentisate 1,2-dioxygenase [Chitinophagales bacterium]HNJ89668.1 homogentisate 1,2-dioxygenase [Chitinophagales bacterium]HNK97541.1 homogentisate 1,2-dioxygenase [Chitinophagales bacterium]HNM08401.1 homogentisate 1,2-dioxygenase [Chitinophagales bacterium]
MYHQLGKIPNKRHVVYRNSEGQMYNEELVGTQGFSSLSTLAYHIYPPTRVIGTGTPFDMRPRIAIENNMRMLSFSGFDIPAEEDYLQSRKVLFVNSDLHIGLAAPTQSPEYFFKNADADELIFIHKGSGTLSTMYGEVEFEQHDYLVIPRGTIYKIDFDTDDNRFLFIESFSPIYTPRRYRNEFGQLLEHSPFCERDFKKPANLITHDEEGEFEILIKKRGQVFPYTYANHPFDVVGWDGYLYPYAFNIHNFEPITGRIHMPPPIHQNFEGNNFVVCSFVPRLYDYHPQAIPAPYHHSNIDSDEILYYVEGEFMSRNNIKQGQLTLHPAGLPHGPHPGAIERSIGKKETHELAVMIDPFKPVSITETAVELEVEDYYLSWISKQLTH